ncbi:uncharacterized protein LOC136079858 [Hydra vulgaris]|uniref:Uncharacterized protein LOC136079858 n=1 Tax=Hydra vulgaris TaxID=6087 RepID=A0ABM4BTV2_HYDVU
MAGSNIFFFSEDLDFMFLDIDQNLLDNEIEVNLNEALDESESEYNEETISESSEEIDEEENVKDNEHIESKVMEDNIQDLSESEEEIEKRVMILILTLMRCLLQKEVEKK